MLFVNVLLINLLIALFRYAEAKKQVDVFISVMHDLVLQLRMFKRRRDTCGLMIDATSCAPITLDHHFFLHSHFSSRSLVTADGVVKNSAGIAGQERLTGKKKTRRPIFNVSVSYDCYR